MSSPPANTTRSAFAFSLTIVTVSIFLFALVITRKATKTSSVMNFRSNPSKSVGSIGSWTIYKHTVSINSGSYLTVKEFVNTYLTQVDASYNLGCNDTFKVVGDLTYSSLYDTDIYGFTQIHWVDSSVFETSGSKTVEEWNSYIEDLGYDTFNPFMLNKVQMFVPDLNAHYSTAVSGGITTILRLSTSTGGDTSDTAHIAIPVPSSGHIYEIVGPSSTLTSTQLEDFTTFSDDECSSAHSLPNTIDYYTTLYTSADFTDSNTAWTEATGLPIPMGVNIMIPTSNLDVISPTSDLVSDVTSATSTSTSYTTCKVMDITIGTDEHVEPNVRYVEMTSGVELDFSIKDWEDDVKTSHHDLDMKASYSQWNRYLDTHLGVLYVTETDDECTSSAETVLSTITSSDEDYHYSPRGDEGIHYYVGTAGIVSWEFNLYGCTSDYTNICGCISDNNVDEYEAETGTDECPHF